MVDVPRTAGTAGMSDRDRRDISMSGLTEPEAREFHRVFITSFIVFVVVALVAHFLVWQWRPWLPGEGGYSAVTDGVRLALDAVAARFA